ncbi:glycoside hydrolase family 16 protein [Candidatus Korobacter versatilis]|nr:glycoside hydrolase family 16 protein [Candidatus Koribacter versatilis]
MRSLLRVLAILLFCLPSAFAQDWGSPVWQDEFNQAAGSPLDPQKWVFDLGDLKVNHEVEIYCPGFPSQKDQLTARRAEALKEIEVCDPKDGNVSFDGEHLILRAVKHSGVWTSGRIKTQGKQTFQYGRIEARMKLPFGAGIWPAFWGLGENITKVGWPASGEIDIMEDVPEIGGLGPTRIRSTVHGPGYSGEYGVRNDIEFPKGERVDNGFHTYGVIWSPNMMQFYLDDPKNVFFVMTPRELVPGKEWVYNAPFFLIANLAIGSEKSWSGATNESTPNPADMLIDYVRVYKAAKVEGPKIERAAAGSGLDLPIKLSAKAGSGRMYLECLSVAPGVSCATEPHVVDFSSGSSASAILRVTAQKTPVKEADIVLKIYTVSGEETSQTFHLKLQ